MEKIPSSEVIELEQWVIQRILHKCILLDSLACSKPQRPNLIFTEDRKCQPISESCVIGDSDVGIFAKDWRYVLAVVNSSTLQWFINREPIKYKRDRFKVFKLPMPVATAQQIRIVSSVAEAALLTKHPRFEQLANALVFELFFPEELHKSNMYVFDACEEAGVLNMLGIDGNELHVTAERLLNTLFSTRHIVYAMLFDLVGLLPARIVDGRY